jgi:Rhodopirellula transposase DDE domain
MNLLLSRLDERQRRWYLAVESQRLGQGADRFLFEITGVDEKTIRRGREELAASLADQPMDRVRQPGGGRPPVEKKSAGDSGGTRGAGRARNGWRSDAPAEWVRSSLRALSVGLEKAGHAVSPPTVGRLLRKLEYSLHVNSKQLEARSNRPDRDSQFAYIADQLAEFRAAGQPIISVDTKKKELIGDFKQPGRTWTREPIPVNIHDFLQDSLGRAVPYGVYDVLNNRGMVLVGTSADTPAFAVDAIAHWWQRDGQFSFATADRLLILADAGGSNSCRARLWKERLQAVLCDRLKLQVTVCHYPTGCSKWNPIEHRLFSFISSNCAGTPLRTWEFFLAAIRGTTTKAGLMVDAVLHSAPYQTGVSVTDALMRTLNLEPHLICPTWNYTLRPRQPASP